MPRYELMYIVASSVSDDQIPATIDGVLNLIKGDAGTIIKEEGLGKKKLAYPIGKTRNGFYDLVNFELDGEKLNALNTKIQNHEGVIRHMIINLEEANQRMAKDAAEQEKMNRNRAANAQNMKTPEMAEGASQSPVLGSEATPGLSGELSSEVIDQKIEDALSEDLDKI